MAMHWQLEPKQLSRGKYQGSLEACHTGRMQVALAHHGCGSRFEGLVPKGTLVLCLPHPTETPMQFRGTRVGGRDIFVQDSETGIDFSFLGPITIFSIAVQRDLLERRAAALWQCDPRRMFQGGMIFNEWDSPENARRGLTGGLQQGLRSPEILAEEEAGRVFDDTILDRLIAGLREPRPVEFSPARRRVARQAAQILHERCREEMSIADLCAAVRASRRTLHLGFLELYGVGPMAYRKILRLNGVRREIRHARRGERNITNSAMSWGFTHLGRFSGDYEAHFGVLPSEEPFASCVC